MLDLQQHFAECDSCEAEARSLRQVKTLLRALHSQTPAAHFSQTLPVRAAEPPAVSFLWQDGVPSLSRPQRGRRLTTALAFSCLTVLVVAAPFAPASRDGMASSGLRAATRFSSGLAVLTGSASFGAAPEADLRPAGFQSLTESDEARREQIFAARYVQSSDPAAPALADDAVRGYVQGDAAFAGYRIR